MEMKKIFLICVLGTALSSCSLLQRHNSGDDYEVKDIEPGQVPPAAAAAAATEPEPQNSAMDTEISKLHTKISALETKVEVLNAGLERLQAQKSQPVIQAEMPSQHAMAAPLETAHPAEEASGEAQEGEAEVSAAPIRPAPAPAKTVDTATNAGAERDFRAAMKLFQSGRNLESASQFAMVAKKYPDHLLAAHALYWAGEASARGQQWSIAIENWSELEKKYPHSAYLPEALAGLAKAYESQGDTAKAKKYRSLVAKSFPKSPVAMRVEGNDQPENAAPARGKAQSKAQATDPEDAPVFQSEAPSQDEGKAESQ
jgi:TolA-binding protein